MSKKARIEELEELEEDLETTENSLHEALARVQHLEDKLQRKRERIGELRDDYDDLNRQKTWCQLSKNRYKEIVARLVEPPENVVPCPFCEKLYFADPFLEDPPTIACHRCRRIYVGCIVCVSGHLIADCFVCQTEKARVETCRRSTRCLIWIFKTQVGGVWKDLASLLGQALWETRKEEVWDE